MKQNDMNHYLPKLTEVIQKTEDTGGEMNTDFEKLRTAIDNDSVAALGQATLTEIKTTFQRGTDVYLSNLNELQQAPVPVRLLGRHKQLVAAYRNYQQACQAMVDAIDADGVSVNVDVFNESEREQENMMTKVTSTTQRIMATVM
ncbi:hypothetical protein GPK34_03185 [Secundilactobacillus kimchicus]|uniref:LXG domain-containing protein n=2 Tax=Secundilactobacillus kimchicus TaxID=528209 RepID=A0A0R1HN89_9LACO|nr:hypothetical protein [Secundilactobacillus kimchicus]KRK47996.1 hypothetical protein FC96_GL001724 [Secundilactobacillus kimchicus JCM 15530]MBT9671041.1 hypothetical protein [Secundilactobacillus kimchicus]